VRLYQASLACYPTAEAHTFLGWAYTFQNRIEDAIAECKKAIAVVSPHAGYVYSGPVAGAVFSTTVLPALSIIIGYFLIGLGFIVEGSWPYFAAVAAAWLLLLLAGHSASSLSPLFAPLAGGPPLSTTLLSSPGELLLGSLALLALVLVALDAAERWRFGLRHRRRSPGGIGLLFYIHCFSSARWWLIFPSAN
jgi:hypothetical protein